MLQRKSCNYEDVLHPGKQSRRLLVKWMTSVIYFRPKLPLLLQRRRRISQPALPRRSGPPLQRKWGLSMVMITWRRTLSRPHGSPQHPSGAAQGVTKMERGREKDLWSVVVVECSSSWSFNTYPIHISVLVVCVLKEEKRLDKVKLIIVTSSSFPVIHAQPPCPFVEDGLLL